MLTWHWALLHVVDSPLSDKSPDGEQRVETILSVTGRIRLMHAVHKACEYGDGGPALSWPSVYAYMQRYHHAFLVSCELCLNDQWYPQLKAKQMELLHKGAAPHLHDDLQRQLISAARGNLNTSWLDELRGTMSRPHAQHPAAPDRTNPNPAPSVPKACAYCLGDYQTSQHPAEEPITQPCSKCRQPHAPVGKLATPCPAADLLAFLDGLRVVRRSFKPSGAREAANRRYLALGCRGDSAPPTLTWTTPPRPRRWLGKRAELLEGAPLMWTGRPPRSRKNNYKSCFDNNNAAGVNFDRIIALGFCEGPLHHLPWIVNPIACIIKTVPTYKVRNVVDLGRRTNPAVPAAHLPEWRRLLMGTDGLEDLRLRSSTNGTYRSSLRDYCSFCAAHGATPLLATLGLLCGYIYHYTSDRSLAPSTIAGRLAAISD
eukprot:jgi/Tetstr1/435145/TSEL_000230.t1